MSDGPSDAPAPTPQPPVARDDAQLRVILFDVGGVLVEFGGVPAMLAWLDGRLDEAQLWHAWLHSPSVRAFETGRIEPGAFAHGVIREFGLRVTSDEFLAAFGAWATGLFPGAIELLARIPHRYTRAVLSNSNVMHWERIRGTLGLGAALDHEFASHLTGRIKPDEDAFRHVAESLGCAPQEILFLDDNGINVEVAVRLGLRGVVVRGVAGCEQALRCAGVLA